MVALFGGEENRPLMAGNEVWAVKSRPVHGRIIAVGLSVGQV